MKNVQQFLKASLKEAGLTQDEAADRIGWVKQNLNYKLNHKNARFCSMLEIAEGIGLACHIKGADPDGAREVIKTATELDISFEDFDRLISSLGFELSLDWRAPGDTLYMLTDGGEA